MNHKFFRHLSMVIVIVVTTFSFNLAQSSEQSKSNRLIAYYVFGHSLYTWNAQREPGSTAESTTGYWLGSLAQDNRKSSGGTGQWGQLDYHRIPPIAHYKYVTDTFDPWSRGEFEDQDFTHVIIMPSNFKQNWLNPQQYMEQTERVIDYIASKEPQTEILIYEHWPKPSLAGSIKDRKNLDRAEWDMVLGFTSGKYHQWFVEWQNLILKKYPGLKIRMIPVGPVIADLLASEDYIKNIAYTDLYVDGAPHGTRTKYFLSALVMYRAMFLDSPKSSYAPPPNMIAKEVSNNLKSIIEYIDERLDYYDQKGVNVYLAK